MNAPIEAVSAIVGSSDTNPEPTERTDGIESLSESTYSISR